MQRTLQRKAAWIAASAVDGAAVVIKHPPAWLEPEAWASPGPGLQRKLNVSSEADGTAHFGMGGAEYETDPNTEHVQQLRDALTSYISAASRAAGGTAARPAVLASP
jgi:hypothetical protein